MKPPARGRVAYAPEIRDDEGWKGVGFAGGEGLEVNRATGRKCALGSERSGNQRVEKDYRLEEPNDKSVPGLRRVPSKLRTLEHRYALIGHGHRWTTSRRGTLQNFNGCHERVVADVNTP